MQVCEKSCPIFRMFIIFEKAPFSAALQPLSKSNVSSQRKHESPCHRVSAQHKMRCKKARCDVNLPRSTCPNRIASQSIICMRMKACAHARVCARMKAFFDAAPTNHHGHPTPRQHQILFFEKRQATRFAHACVHDGARLQ